MALRGASIHISCSQRARADTATSHLRATIWVTKAKKALGLLSLNASIHTCSACSSSRPVRPCYNCIPGYISHYVHVEQAGLIIVARCPQYTPPVPTVTPDMVRQSIWWVFQNEVFARYRLTIDGSGN